GPLAARGQCQTRQALVVPPESGVDILCRPAFLAQKVDQELVRSPFAFGGFDKTVEPSGLAGLLHRAPILSNRAGPRPHSRRPQPQRKISTSLLSSLAGFLASRSPAPSVVSHLVYWRRLRTPWCGRSLLHARIQAPGHHQPQHAEVADERPERMTKGGGRVLFQQKMAGPRKAVAERNPQQGIPGMMREKGDDRDHQTQSGSDGVHPAISCLAVLFQIEAEELFVGTECLRFRHDKHPLAER